MALIDKEELLEKLEEQFGDLDDNSGCYSRDAYGRQSWLSVKRIVDIINSCCEED